MNSRLLWTELHCIPWNKPAETSPQTEKQSVIFFTTISVSKLCNKTYNTCNQCCQCYRFLTCLRPAILSETFGFQDWVFGTHLEHKGKAGAWSICAYKGKSLSINVFHNTTTDSSTLFKVRSYWVFWASSLCINSVCSDKTNTFNSSIVAWPFVQKAAHHPVHKFLSCDCFWMVQSLFGLTKHLLNMLQTHINASSL